MQLPGTGAFPTSSCAPYIHKSRPDVPGSRRHITILSLSCFVLFFCSPFLPSPSTSRPTAYTAGHVPATCSGTQAIILLEYQPSPISIHRLHSYARSMLVLMSRPRPRPRPGTQAHAHADVEGPRRWVHPPYYFQVAKRKQISAAVWSNLDSPLGAQANWLQSRIACRQKPIDQLSSTSSTGGKKPNAKLDFRLPCHRPSPDESAQCRELGLLSAPYGPPIMLALIFMGTAPRPRRAYGAH